MAYKITLKKPRKEVYLVDANNKEQALHFFEENELIVNHENEPTEPHYEVTGKEDEQEKHFEVKSKKISADGLMKIDSKIWDKHGWGSGDDVDYAVYKKELKEELDKKGITKLPYKIYLELEDENYHTENQALVDLGILKEPTEKEREEYSY